MTLALAASVGSLITACGSITSGGGSAAGRPGDVRIVAAENFWGSIASQLGGMHASVQSIIVDPNQDPHSYEPRPADARALATAQLALINGVGYDPWAPRLLAANPVSGRDVIDVGRLLGLHLGDNPHRWYDPNDVETVADAITAALKRLDSSDATYFDSQRQAFERQGLAQYHRLIAQIRARYAGVRVGASESIFALQAPALGLDLITPPEYMKAISEGSEPSAQDTATVRRQISQREIDIWVYNSQNATADIQRLNALARAQRIPIATVTETLAPASASFEQWQVAQLQGIARALHEATGR